jgi:VanZ family protein
MKALLNNKKLILVCALAWTILIIIGCSLPGSAVPKVPLFPHFDKLVHFTFFLIFTMLWSIYCNCKWRYTIYIIIIAIIFGWFIEIYQKNFIVGRTFDVYDIVADAVGAFSFLLMYTWMSKHIISKNH